MFPSVTVKLGNMRKAQDFTIYPASPDSERFVIQSDKRIAQIDVAEKIAILSNGKGGHPGRDKLTPQAGAVLVPVSSELIEEIKQKVGRRKDYGTGIVSLTG